MNITPNVRKLSITVAFVAFFEALLLVGLYVTGQEHKAWMILGPVIIAAYIYVKISLLEARTKG